MGDKEKSSTKRTSCKFVQLMCSLDGVRESFGFGTLSWVEKNLQSRKIENK